MMLSIKSIIVTIFLIYLSSTFADDSCTIGQNPTDDDKFWLDMNHICVLATKKQIQKEINASIAYLAMAAHFSKDEINRPGFADFFFHSASEEREHGMKLIEYLDMRGELTDAKNTLLTVPYPPKKIVWESGMEALKDALALEVEVTQSIRELITTCENVETRRNKNEIENDYHLVDYLTSVYLEEQYKGQRELAGKISTLGKMNAQYKHLGEFLFDKKM